MKVWLLVMMTHGGWTPVLEVPNFESCKIYQDIYTDNGHSVYCGEYERRRGIPFRPQQEKKTNGSISTQSGETFRPTA